MIKIFIMFFGLFCSFYFGIAAFRALSGLEKLELAKLVLYSALCTVLSVVTMTVIVLLF